MSKPGISGSTSPPGANRPIIRGLDNYRVRIQENGIAHARRRRPVGRPRHSHRSVLRRSGRGRARPGDAALRQPGHRRRRQRHNNRIPTFIPRGGITAEVKGGFTSVDDGRDGAFQVTAGARRFRDPRRRLQAHADDYDTPQGTQLNTFVESDGGSVGGSIIGSDGYIGVSYSRFASLYGIPGRGGRERARAHRHGAGQDLVARASGGCTPTASRPSATGSAGATTRITSWIDGGLRRRLALHQPRDGGPRRGPARARR